MDMTIPAHIWRLNNATLAQKVALSIIEDHSDDGKCVLTSTELGEMLGLSRTATNDMITAMRNKGLIESRRTRTEVPGATRVMTSNIRRVEGMESMTQTQRVTAWLDKNVTITSSEAQRFMGIARLASRINDLRKSGIPIVTDFITVRNRYGEDCSIARYRYATKGDQHGND